MSSALLVTSCVRVALGEAADLCAPRYPCVYRAILKSPSEEGY